MKITLDKDGIKELERTGLCVLDCDAENPEITFEKLEGKGVWKMDIHHEQYEQCGLDDWDGPCYVYTQLIVPETMVKQYVEAAGGVFEQ